MYFTSCPAHAPLTHNFCCERSTAISQVFDKSNTWQQLAAAPLWAQLLTSEELMDVTATVLNHCGEELDSMIQIIKESPVPVKLVTYLAR